MSSDSNEHRLQAEREECRRERITLSHATGHRKGRHLSSVESEAALQVRVEVPEEVDCGRGEAEGFQDLE